MTTTSSHLESLRPHPVALDDAWAAETLTRILADPADPAGPAGGRSEPTRIRPSRPHRTRRPVALVAAATLVLAGTTAAMLVRPGDAAAADLRALAAGASTYDGPVLQEGSWLHERITSLQRNSATLGDGAVLDDDDESWTAWDGRTYLIQRRPSTGRVDYDVIDDRAPASYADPTPRFSATLPDTADGLLGYLDPRVVGSTTHDEALFSALTHLATSHTLPPRTLAAAFEALATLDHVTTRDTRVDDRAAVVVAYEEDSTHSTQELTVDRASGQVLATRDLSRQSDYVSTTQRSEVVTEVPADVRTAFAQHLRDGHLRDGHRRS